MPITRATNLAGLGTVFDGSGLTFTGITTTVDLNATRVNVTGVGTISTGSITTLNATTGNIVTGVTTNFTSTNVVISGVTTVSAGTTALPSISPSGDPNTGIFFPSADTIAFSEGGAEAVRIDSSGRLLIGTSSVINNGYGGTSGLFQVSKDDFLPIGFFSFTSTAADGYCPYLELHRARGTKASPTIVSNGDELGEINFYGYDGSAFRRGASIRSYVDAAPGSDDMPSRLVFYTSADGSATPTERMRISQNGLTAIKAAVGASGAALTWENTVNSSGVFAGVSNLGSNANNTSSYHYIAATGGADKFYVFGNGNVVNVNNSYGSLSDLKIKENIIDATSQWSDIKNLQVRKYNFKEETGHQTHTQIGIIAQEVELTSPGLVTESPDRDKEGNDLGTVTKSVNYSVLYMKAVKALQEAMERIEQLESAVASLQGD